MPKYLLVYHTVSLKSSLAVKSNAMALPYTYLPLDRSLREIRLIKLQPCGFHGADDVSSRDVHCRIFPASLDEEPIYTALSYTWGDPTITMTVTLDNVAIEVTENLHSALQHLQHETQELILWIDAICINQKDDEEKSWQVQQMRDVYEKAASVMVWLGPAKDDSDLAMKKLKIFGDKVKHHNILEFWEYQFRASQWIDRKLPDLQLQEDESTLEQILSTMSVSDDESADLPVSPILAILSRSWWQRVWVLQEISVAKAAMFRCGTKTIEVNSLSAALTAFRLYQQAITGTLYEMPASIVPIDFDARPYMMLSTRRTDEFNFSTLPLVMLLQSVCRYTRRTRRLDSTDPRDMVYALLGLSNDSEELGVRPDYTKPCWQLFTEVMKSIIKADDDPWLLHLCYFPKQLTDLPSWVPDWSAFSTGREMPTAHEWGPDKMIFGNVLPPFSASGSLNYIAAAQGEDPRSFRLHGIIIDKIEVPLSMEYKKLFEAVFDIGLSSGQTDWTRSRGYYRASSSEETGQRFSNALKGQDQASEGHATPESSIFHRQKQLSSNYIAVKPLDPRGVLARIKLVQQFVSGVRKLASHGGNIYGDALVKEEAVWRTIIADHQPVEDDKFLRPATSHYYLNLFMLHENCGEVEEELRPFTDKAITQRAFDKLQEWDIFGKLDMDVMRVLSFGSEGSLYPIVRKPDEELIPKLFALGAMVDLDVSPEEYAEAVRTRQSPFDEEDYLNRFMTQVSKAFYQSGPEETGQEFVDLAEAAILYMNTLRSQLIGRIVFVTSKGYLGLGPQHLQADDVVSIIQGAVTPFILRPTGDGRYQLVGEAYVHGIMDGEALTPETKMDVIELI